MKNRILKVFCCLLLTSLLLAMIPGAVSANASGELTAHTVPDNATYNGIVIPDGYAFGADFKNGDPEPIPYLMSESEGGYAPEVVNVDRGRQLFVDDFLIESTNLNRQFYAAVKSENNPVLKPETQWETTTWAPGTAMTSGGLFYDMSEGVYKVWYEAGFNNYLAYATSTDGIQWTRPVINADGSNLLVRDQHTDSFSVWMTQDADVGERYKLMIRSDNDTAAEYGLKAKLYSSQNGKQWREIGMTAGMGDRSTFFYNPFTNQWVFSIRSAGAAKWGDVMSSDVRTRHYSADADFLKAAQWAFNNWNFGDTTAWLKTDSLDLKRTEISNCIPECYNFDAVAYESVMVGMYQIWYGPSNAVIEQTKNPKITELQACFSRDGFHFDRTNRNAIIPASNKEGAWDYGYLQSTTGGMIVYDDEIRIYYSGFSGEYTKADGTKIEGPYVGGAVGYATLRRDGFASMDGTGSLTTNTLTVTKDVKHLFVNVDSSAGSLRAEVLDAQGRVIEGYSAAECTPIVDNTCKVMLSWGEGKDLSMLHGKAFKLRFYLENGSLFSFWLAPDENGESGGEVAAGYVKTATDDTDIPQGEAVQTTASGNAADTKDGTGGCGGCGSALSLTLPTVVAVAGAVWMTTTKKRDTHDSKREE